ncbi:hypothetical protein EV361DRAFT_937291 [Lentinula raphanica]|uniref:Uncharacterized protein n=1 Tax=Lentinula raphanica TaxID=153919 RepID=A0AA38UKV3_9AGAR|nr:hypothetical protein C8R42DRAFT_453255 [Lentinula raphanica]KAJ3775028.1 hypothetical protein FB446DRAFT_726516 [Lentinula raphanica]KAJ3819015.1 hypothetical protein F5880DRAFT_1158529 [Lentinula raphanica]KAJ3845487.1 hypothetical protein F5878DRAFT_599328 [Lentinula raphanica]KAJ3965916.1 hypothetical protein EV361DRAFT_937291 [Lentinula raphanica]
MIPHQIRKLTYFSLSISFVVFVFSLGSNLGGNSFFLDPIAAFLTIILHLSLLLLSRRHQPHTKSLPYPLSSGIPSIACHWLLGCLWTASSVLIMFTAVCAFLESYSNTTRALVLIEPVFATCESVLLLTIAVLITKHRDIYAMHMSHSTSSSPNPFTTTRLS